MIQFALIIVFLVPFILINIRYILIYFVLKEYFIYLQDFINNSDEELYIKFDFINNSAVNTHIYISDVKCFSAKIFNFNSKISKDRAYIMLADHIRETCIHPIYDYLSYIFIVNDFELVIINFHNFNNSFVNFISNILLFGEKIENNIYITNNKVIFGSFDHTINDSIRYSYYFNLPNFKDNLLKMNNKELLI